MAKGEEFKCRQDPNTKELVCHSFKQNKDGATVDAECRPVITDMEEHYPGEFEKLEKKVVNRLVGKCKATPSDF